MTQPAVSQHIRYIENYYNVKLFNYKNKKLELTEQGLYLKKQMETLSNDVKHMRDSIQWVQKRKHIKLGATLTIGEFYLPDRLSAFMNANQTTDFSVTIADTKELLGRLDQGEIDVALCEGYFNKIDYGYMLIKNEDMCIICSADYDFSGITDLKTLFAHHLLIREKGSGTREVFERYLRENNYSLDNFDRISDFTSPHLIKKLVLDGRGITVLYKTAVERELADKTLKEVAIPDFNVTHEFNAIWKKGSIFDVEYKRLIHDLLKS